MVELSPFVENRGLCCNICWSTSPQLKFYIVLLKLLFFKLQMNATNTCSIKYTRYPVGTTAKNEYIVGTSGQRGEGNECHCREGV